MKTQQIEVATVYEAMVFFRGNQTKASQLLGINRATLTRYLKPENRDKYLVQVIRNDAGHIETLDMINRMRK